MKFRAIILLAVTVLAFAFKAGNSWAAEPMFAVTSPESNYTESHSTMTVSSATIGVMASIASTTRYRQVTLGDPKCPSRVFYTTNGSSANIIVIGDWIDAGQQKTIETGNKIWFQVENGTAPVVIRAYQSTK